MPLVSIAVEEKAQSAFYLDQSQLRSPCKEIVQLSSLQFVALAASSKPKVSWSTSKLNENGIGVGRWTAIQAGEARD